MTGNDRHFTQIQALQWQFAQSVAVQRDRCISRVIEYGVHIWKVCTFKAMPTLRKI